MIPEHNFMVGDTFFKVYMTDLPFAIERLEIKTEAQAGHINWHRKAYEKGSRIFPAASISEAVKMRQIAVEIAIEWKTLEKNAIAAKITALEEFYAKIKTES
jgi:hypothetical protein